MVHLVGVAMISIWEASSSFISDVRLVNSSADLNEHSTRPGYLKLGYPRLNQNQSWHILNMNLNSHSHSCANITKPLNNMFELCQIWAMFMSRKLQFVINKAMFLRVECNIRKYIRGNIGYLKIKMFRSLLHVLLKQYAQKRWKMVTQLL